MKYPLVRIEWADTTVYSGLGWEEIEDLISSESFPISLMETVGYLIREDRREYRVVNTMGKTKVRALGLTIIPTSYVMTVQVLGKKGWRSRRIKRK